MSRRDTIIVAVLINAGLLIVLFASALKSNSPSEEFVTSPIPVIQETPDLVFKKEVSPVTGDEVDLALNQYTQNSMATAQSVLPPASSHRSLRPLRPHSAQYLPILRMILKP